MDFQSKSAGQNPRPLQRGRGIHLLWEKGLPSTSPGWNYPGQVPKLLEIRPRKITGVTIEDTETELSWQGKIYVCRRVHRCTGTASMRSRQSVLLFIPDTVGPAPLLGLVQLRCTIWSWLANVTPPIGFGVGSNFAWKWSSVNQKLQMQAAKKMTHFDRKNCFPHTKDRLFVVLPYSYRVTLRGSHLIGWGLYLQLQFLGL
jgi:hypothetical protein